MNFAVENWAPSYGAATEDVGAEEATAEVERNVEIPEATWKPIRPSVQPPSEIAFVDGTNRIDAQVWIDEPDEVSLYAERRSAGPYPTGAASGRTSVRTQAWHSAVPAWGAAQTLTERWLAPVGDGAALA